MNAVSFDQNGLWVLLGRGRAETVSGPGASWQAQVINVPIEYGSSG